MCSSDLRLVLLDTRRPVKRPMYTRPPALQQRSAPWPMHVAKLVKWRLVLAWRRMQEAVAKVGTLRRYDAFFHLGERSMLGLPVAPIDVPLTYLYVDPSRAEGWSDHVVATAVQASGDHLSMVQPPHATQTAAVLRGVVEQVNGTASGFPALTAP